MMRTSRGEPLGDEYTVCARCKHCIHAGKGGPRENVWYNFACNAPNVKEECRVDYEIGTWTWSKRACRDVNTEGHCRHYEVGTPLEVEE